MHGKTQGLKSNQIKRLSNLYRRRVPPESALTVDLARALSELSVEFARGVSVLIDRRGRVVTVAVGDASDTPLPEYTGEAESRLSGLRLAHTHLKPGGLSGADLTTLFLNRLDAIVAIDPPDERSGGLNGQLATIAPASADEEDWLIDPQASLREIESLDIKARIEALEEELSRSGGPRSVKRSSAERAVLVGLASKTEGAEGEARLAELEELVRSAGGVVAAMSFQQRERPDHRTLVGAGKLQEVVALAFHEDADLLVFDRELSPAQAREIEAATKLKVLDRTQVILDIFAQHARGREAQLQVELAQLQYQLPRLAGRGQAMSRLGGGIGTRGPGETKLEVDRRRIRDRLAWLEKAVSDISKRRAETRKQRTASSVPVIALVGYTNAGKSTLFNALTHGDALTQDKLFATLRPTTREAWLPELGEWGSKVVFTDTVGFIRDLPDELVNAFRATLEELHHADLLLHVVDGAAPGAPERVSAVERILDQLDLEPPRMIVVNKADAADAEVMASLAARFSAVGVSATHGTGIAELKQALAAALAPVAPVTRPGGPLRSTAEATPGVDAWIEA